MTGSTSPSSPPRAGPVALAALAGAAAMLLVTLVAGESLRRNLFDAWQRTAPRTIAAREVAVVLVDPPSLAAVGGWPWPRYYLARLTETFEQTASGVVADLGGRVVKMIGDEIMFVAFDARTAVEIALTLIEKLGEIDDLPQVHAGVATGPVLLRFGDVYGSTVNIAARLTGITRGLDPKAVSVPEVGFAEFGRAEYARALAGYASGRPDGVASWVVHCCRATEHGALEGLAIAEALFRG